MTTFFKQDMRRLGILVLLYLVSILPAALSSGHQAFAVNQDTSFRVCGDPVGLTYSWINFEMYVSCAKSIVALYSQNNSLAASIPIQGNPGFGAYALDNHEIYSTVTHYHKGEYYGSVAVINSTTQSVQSYVQLGEYENPESIAYDPNNQWLYVAVAGRDFSGQLIIINSHNDKLGETIKLGKYTWPMGVAYDYSDKMIYVANYYDNSVIAVSGTKIVARIIVGLSPFGVCYDSQNHDVYVSNSNSYADGDTVTAIHGLNWITTISVGTQPTGIAYNSFSSSVYVANSDDGTVSIMHNNGEVTTVKVEKDPGAVAYDPANNFVYVASAYENSVTLLQ